MDQQALTDPAGNMHGKTVMITGASSGLGKITALDLARQGAEVVLVVRNQEKGNHLRQELMQATGNPNIFLLVADLSRMAAVMQLAEEFKKQFKKLDVLVNNAGIMPGKFKLTEEGLEVSWATNHLSAFLLTNLLMDELFAAGPARIINVSSEAHRLGQINFQQIGKLEKYSSFTAYCDSKLANILFTYELNRRLELTDISVNTLHPGVVATNFAKDTNKTFKLLYFVGKPFMASAEKGAQTQIYLATAPELEGISGQYFINKKATRSSRQTYDHGLARRLWHLSESQTGFKV